MRRGLFLAGLLMTTALARAAAESVQATTFSNGLLWLHRPVTHNQIMAFYLFFPGGSLQEPERLSGMTTLMTSVMFKGTSRRPARQIAEEIESMGASLDGGSEEDYWDLNGQVTADKFDKAMEILQDILLNPTFPPAEFEKEKQAQLNAIRAKKEQIFNVAFDRFQREAFGRHPYGRPEEGTHETVSRLTREDLLRWHRERVTPKGAVLVTVGPRPRKTLEKTLAKAFGAWTSGSAAPPSAERPSFPSKPRLAEEVQPFEQSYLMLGFPAAAIADKDYAAVKLLNAMLGSGMSSPLFQVVREEGGLAYEVSSFFPSRRLGSAFVVYAGTDPKNLENALRKITEMLNAFLKMPVSEKALADAKRYIRGHYMMDHQTNRSLARYLGWWEILGKGHAYDALYVNDIQAVTAADVRAAAERVLNHPPVIVKIKGKGAP